MRSHKRNIFINCLLYALLFQEHQANYNILLSVLDTVVEKLQDGVKLCDVYNAALSYIKENKSELQGNFVKSIG